MKEALVWIGIVALFLVVAIPVLGLLGKVWFDYPCPGGC
jgi:hypothetical protein